MKGAIPMSKDTESGYSHPIVKDVKNGALYIGDIKGDVPIKTRIATIWPAPSQIKFKAAILDTNPAVAWESDYMPPEAENVAEIPKGFFLPHLHKVVTFAFFVKSEHGEVESGALEARILPFAE
jgi:hypothetical protein